jgi:5-hydroxyisourate hydrolase
MKRISTHVLDTARGKPVANLVVRLAHKDSSGAWRELSSAKTDHEGRCAQLLPPHEDPREGQYRLCFDTSAYFSQQSITGLYPVVEIIFEARADDDHFHIPLLLGPNSYTTYRGS